MTELYISQSGEAIIVNKDEANSKKSENNNPFMQLSNNMIADWSPSMTQNAAKTWKSTLKSSDMPLSQMGDDDKQKQNLFLQDFLNSILPPIPTETEEQQTIYSLVSTKQATRNDLDQMKQTYEALIHQRRARECGLDSIRCELSFQLFDELIRQIAIDCKERGLLLLRLRDEAKVTLQAHGILNQVSSTFSTNKGEKSNKGFEQLIESKAKMLKKKQILQNQRLKLQNKLRDKRKEVEVLSTMQLEQLKLHKMAIQNEAEQLRMLIDMKRRRGTLRNRRKSSKHGKTRRSSIQNAISPNTFSFDAMPKSTPMSPQSTLFEQKPH